MAESPGVFSPDAFATASPAVPDEELKRVHHGGIAAERSNGAYGEQLPNTAVLQTEFCEHYLQPFDQDIAGVEAEICEWLQDGRTSIVIPMKEDGPKIRPLLGTLTKLMPSGMITVVDNLSDDDALNCVLGFPGVRLIFADDVHEAIRWDLLLEVLNLKKRPAGKGVAVLCGYLCEHARWKANGVKPLAITQHDAEIALYEKYQALRYLTWARMQRPNAHYLKIAKTGRGNEVCMAARSMLPVIANLVDRSTGGESAVGKRARDLFRKLVPHKWMLTGEFQLDWDLAMSRLFATGYLEETLTSICAEDFGDQCGKHTVHVANPNPRLDAPNDHRKEAVMQQQIGNFVTAMAGQKPTNEWTLADIAEFNRTVMDDPIVMGWIPPNDNAVVAEVLSNDRIIPSVGMLVDGGFVDLDRLVTLVTKK